MDDQRHNPTNSYSRHQMGVNDEFHEPVVLFPGKDIRYPLDRRLKSLRTVGAPVYQITLRGLACPMF
jgi:hypothetical protein